MLNAILLITSLISALISYLTGLVFIISFLKEHKFNRFIWGIAFILYAIGHTIVAVITAMGLSSTEQSYLIAMWIYVNVAGAGTTGLILYSTFPFVTENKMIKYLVTSIFFILYIVGSLILAFVLPANNPLAIVNLSGIYSQLNNMSWWVVEILIPASFFIGFVFIRHYKTSGTLWGLLIGLSFVIYAIILFIWPIPELKPIFYIIRTISVGLLGIGGVLLARE